MTTPLLALPEIAESQAGKYITHNQALHKLEALMAHAKSRTTSAEPGSPAEGDVYILPASPTGTDWSTYAQHDIAHYYSGAWHNYTPSEGWPGLWVDDENVVVRFTGSSWVDPIENGGYAKLADNEAVTGAWTFSSTTPIAFTGSGGGVKLDGLASSNANTLDDYEEGTWSPVISDGTNNATMDSGTFGRYTKVGDIVHVYGRCDVSSLGSVSGGLRITGLPFTTGSSGQKSGAISRASGLSITAGHALSLYAFAGETYMIPVLWDATAGNTTLQASELTAAGDFNFSMSYKV